MLTSGIKKNINLIIYGISLAILLFLLKWLEMHFFIITHSFEIYIGAIAIIFTALGAWLTSQLIHPVIKVVEKEVYIEKEPEALLPAIFMFDETAQSLYNISNRELEVLHLMAGGLSNQEIAESLFVSLNTVKTHSSNIFEKLDVSRRMQAVEKAKKLSLIP